MFIVERTDANLASIARHSFFIVTRHVGLTWKIFPNSPLSSMKSGLKWVAILLLQNMTRWRRGQGERADEEEGEGKWWKGGRNCDNEEEEEAL